MKALSVVALLFVAAIIATVPISPQVTPRGIELSVDQAQAQVTYGRARRIARRADRRSYRYARRAGYGAAVYGSGYSYGYRYPVVAAGPGRSCRIYPSGFRWCWTYF
jgi:hypothetical protein